MSGFPRGVAAAAGDDGFRDPAHRNEILAALRTLSASAATLREHGADRGFDHLREALVTDTDEALDAYRREEYPIAHFAEHAYAFLERYVLASYNGLDGTHVPAETRARLIELRNMIESR